jgi:hypothetical protein
MWTRSVDWSFSSSVRIFEHRVTYASAGDICFLVLWCVVSNSLKFYGIRTRKVFENVVDVGHVDLVCNLKIFQFWAEIWAQSDTCFCRWYLFSGFVTCSFLFKFLGYWWGWCLKICGWPVHRWRLWFGISCVWAGVIEFGLSAKISENAFSSPPLFISHV